MQAAKQLKFQLSDELYNKYQQGYTYKNLNIGTLFSFGKLADDNFVSILSRKHVNVFKNDRVVIKACHNPMKRLYNTPLKLTTSRKLYHPANNKPSD